MKIKLYTIFLITILLILLTCNKEENIKQTIVQVSNLTNDFVTNSQDFEFGPFFLPEDKTFKNISINYFTKEPKSTYVMFSMVGEIDWTRFDNTKVIYHKMIFEGLEESTEYTFKILSSNSNLIEISKIKTIPYGENFNFNFGIAKIEENWEFNDSLNFLILLSKFENISQDEFIKLFIKNKLIISSTIIIPLFNYEILRNKFNLIQNGVLGFRYKNAIIVCIVKNFNDYKFIDKFISDDPNDRNYLIIGNIDDKSIIQIINLYNGKVEKIFTYNHYNNEWIEYIENYKIVNINKKEKFAKKREKDYDYSCD